MPSPESSRNARSTSQTREPRGNGFNVAIDRARLIFNNHKFYPYTYKEISDATSIDYPSGRTKGVRQLINSVETRQIELSLGRDLSIDPKVNRAAAEKKAANSIRGFLRRFRTYKGNAQYQLINLNELLEQLPGSPEDRRSLSTVVAPGHPGLRELAQHIAIKNFIVGGVRPVSEIDDPLLSDYDLYLHSDIIGFPDEFAKNTSIAETRTDVLDAFNAQRSRLKYWDYVEQSSNQSETSPVPGFLKTEPQVVHFL